MNKMSKNMRQARKSSVLTLLMVILAFVLTQIALGAGMVSSSLQGQLIPICAWICMAVSLNLVVGISGELSLGHAGFMSVGAFSGAIASTALSGTISNPIVLLLVTILIGGFLAALAGFLVGIPVMRLHGDYLAIVTLAFGEIIKNLLNNMYCGYDDSGLHFSLKSVQALGMKGGRVILNGPQGATGITHLSSFTAGFVLVLVVTALVLCLVNSRSGRAIQAVRDNRIAAESVGINTTKYRLMAFVVAAAFAGMAGVLYALNFSSLVPKKFDFNTSILVLVFVVLGGMGNIRGSIIAATVLTILPEMLRAVNDYRMLVYAVVLIVVMIFSNNPQVKAFRQRLKAKQSPQPVVEAKGGDSDAE